MRAHARVAAREIKPRLLGERARDRSERLVALDHFGREIGHRRNSSPAQHTTLVRSGRIAVMKRRCAAPVTIAWLASALAAIASAQSVVDPSLTLSPVVPPGSLSQPTQVRFLG